MLTHALLAPDMFYLRHDAQAATSFLAPDMQTHALLAADMLTHALLAADMLTHALLAADMLYLRHDAEAAGVPRDVAHLS